MEKRGPEQSSANRISPNQSEISATLPINPTLEFSADERKKKPKKRKSTIEVYQAKEKTEKADNQIDNELAD